MHNLCDSITLDQIQTADAMSTHQKWSEIIRLEERNFHCPGRWLLRPLHALILITLHLGALTCVHVHIHVHFHFHFHSTIAVPGYTYIIFSSGGLLQFVGQKNEKLNLSCVLDLPVLPEQQKKMYLSSTSGGEFCSVCLSREGKPTQTIKIVT